MATLQPVRGTHDLLPEDFRRHHTVAERARGIAELYGFEAMGTPIFEFTDVFRRAVGETTDIVSKEMYSFEDRGGESITLRPEGTAGAVRAFLSNGLQRELPLKWFYHGPMFRYERPQKGRQRQFHQIGVELLGVAAPQADVEVIAVAAQILEAIGVLKDTRLELNTLGDPDSRAAYRAALVEYFSAHRDRLSDDSRTRLERNPLRILDSKDEGDKALVADAPVFGDYLNQASREFFAQVKAGLDALGIAYVHNPRLVRGIDYYTHTCFEFVTEELGAQGTVLAGGRYDGLVETMGGPATPGIGWAAGVERLAMLLADVPAPARPVAVLPVGEDAEAPALKLAMALRRAGVKVEHGYSGNLKKRMARANKANAAMAVILGGDELARGVATLRNLDGGDQREVPLSEIVPILVGKETEMSDAAVPAMGGTAEQLTAPQLRRTRGDLDEPS